MGDGNFGSTIGNDAKRLCMFVAHYVWKIRTDGGLQKHGLCLHEWAQSSRPT
jgi:hypothetical protein